ncbi:MAG TPA: hypothetical protein VFM67_06815 [Gaiella sp.]|nr:hypothetical protein [Gaiella sp.]
MEWAQAASIIAAIAALVGLQTLWIARALDDLARRLDRVDARLDRLETREPPTLRRA